MHKADKCSAVCIKHTRAAVSYAQQQISSTSQVHDSCKTKLVIVIHKTDTLTDFFRRIFGGRKFGDAWGLFLWVVQGGSKK